MPQWLRLFIMRVHPGRSHRCEMMGTVMVTSVGSVKSGWITDQRHPLNLAIGSINKTRDL
jgi:hypothetical protein